MNERGDSFDNSYAEDGELTRPDGRHLPRVLDPVVTMGVVQKYIETEQKRSRRVLFWMSVVFIFAALFIMVLFVSIGMFLYQNSRKAVSISEGIKAQVSSYGAEVAGISGKIGILEDRDNQLKDLVQSVENDRNEENKLFKTDLQRFSRWVESVNARDSKLLSELEIKLREMQRALDAKDKQLEDVRSQYAALMSSAGPTRLYRDTLLSEPVVKASGMEKADAPDGDISTVSTVGLFDAAISLQETNIIQKIEPKGEISVVTFPGGDRYEGEFKGGLLNGRGAYFYKNGDRYTGEFANDMKEGKGSFVFRNGEKYVGDFKNDAMTGKGTMIYMNGNKYAGDFMNALKHGNGVLSFRNGDIYKGDFKEDLRNGKGVYFFADGAKYVGEFKADKRDGQGRYIYAGGEEYIGEFKDGKKDGEGICVYPNGRQFKGLWRADRFVEEVKSR